MILELIRVVRVCFEDVNVYVLLNNIYDWVEKFEFAVELLDYSHLVFFLADDGLVLTMYATVDWLLK